MEQYNKCSTYIIDLLDKYNINPITVYGFTNYLDTRFLLLIKYINVNRIPITDNEMLELCANMNRFIESLDSNGTYFLPGSGTYSLQHPVNDLKTFFNFI